MPGGSSQLLIDVVQKLSFARDLPAVQEIVRRAARRLTGADGAAFILRDGDNCYCADEDAVAPLWKGQKLAIDGSVAGWVMLQRQAAIIADISADPRVPMPVYRDTFVKSLAMVPMRSQDPVGVVGVFWAQVHAATAEEVQLLQALADTAAVALENVRIYDELEQRVRQRTQELEAAYEALRNLSLVDELTGLHNRRGFYVLAEQSRRMARGNGTSQFIAYIDADGLKSVNDARGHHAGDSMIKDLAGVLRQVFRDADVVARIGGDEFCVLGSMQWEASVIVARLFAAIGQFNRKASGGAQLSASCGVCAWPAGSDTALDDVIQQADDAMYNVKQANRFPVRAWIP